MSQYLDRTIEPPVSGFSQISIPYPELFILPNGVEIYAIDAGDQPVNRITVSYDSGIMNAIIPDALQLSVQMLREGTTSYSGSEISNTLDYYGAWLKSDVLTGNTIVSLWSPNKSTSHILPILKEILLAPTFPIKEFETLRQKRKAQYLLSQKNVTYIASQLDKQMVFGKDHPINHILNADEIENLSRDSLMSEYVRAFSRKPKVFVAGEIKEILPIVLDLFSQFSYDTAASTPIEIIPMQPVSSQTLIKDVDAEHQSSIVMSIPTIDRSHEDYISLRLVVMALGGYFGSRLMTNIREDKGYTYGIQANLYGYREGGVISISTNTAPQYVDAVIKEVKYEMQRLCEQPMEEDELNVVKNNAMTSLAAILDSPFSIMDHHISHFHNGTPKDYLEKQIVAIKSLTKDDVLELSRKYLNEDKLLISIAKPAEVAGNL